MKQKFNQDFIKQTAMTFIEIMIVIAIMAAIAALAGPALFNRFSSAKVDQAKLQLKSFVNVLDLYKIDNNGYPSTEQGLLALIKKPEVGTIPPSWSGPYLQGSIVPKDPWGKDYIYESTTNNDYQIKTFGADGIAGGTGNDQDIICTPNACAN